MVVDDGTELEGASALVVVVLGVEVVVVVTDARGAGPPTQEERQMVMTINTVVRAPRQAGTATSSPVLLYYAGEPGSVVAR
jgi:hypothetical protein